MEEKETLFMLIDSVHELVNQGKHKDYDVEITQIIQVK